jgi:hypothetical protein
MKYERVCELWLILFFIFFSFIIYPYYAITIGDSWYPQEEISSDYENTKQFFPSVAVDNGKVHITWCEIQYNWEIMHRIKSDNGWNVNKTITSNSVNNFNPVMAAGNGKVHVTWLYYDTGSDQDVYHKSFDGNQWSTPKEVSSDTTSDDQRSPDIAVDGDNCYIVWMDLGSGDADIHFRHFNGQQWFNEIEISDDSGTENQWYPAVASDNGKAYVTWVDYNDGDGDIYFRYFDGVKWAQEQEISIDSSNEHQDYPSLVSDGDHVYVAWVNYKDGDGDIYFREFDGNKWDQPLEISIDLKTEEQILPSIAADNGHIHVVWQDERDGDKDIFYRYFNKIKWGPIEEISSDKNNEVQDHPAITAKDYGVHIVWQDYGDGYADIYYRHKFYYPAPEVLGIDIQDEHDINHIINHTPKINWTYLDQLSLPQQGYNVSVWSDNMNSGKLMGFINSSGDNREWIYSGSELKDGQSYFVYIKVFNDYKWSSWKYKKFHMNSPPPLPTNPNHNGDVLDLVEENSTILSWKSNIDLDGDKIISIVFGDLNINPPMTAYIPNEDFVKVEDIYDDGTYYWQVNQFDGYEWTNGTIWSFEVKRNDYPILLNGSVFPKFGNENTEFEFNVEYLDEDGDLPASIDIVIDHKSYKMIESDSSDTIVTDGKKYNFKNKLNSSKHIFYFRCDDGRGGTYFTANMSGPSVINPEFGIISGIVIDSDTEKGIKSNVTVINTHNPSQKFTIKTEVDGTFEFSEVIPGEYQIYATAFGYYDSNSVIRSIDKNQRLVTDFQLKKISTNGINTPVTNVNINVDKKEINRGETLNFIASATDDDGDVLIFSWHFEDTGEDLIGEKVTHTFNIEGEFKVTLVVSDTDGNQDTDTVTILVKEKRDTSNEFNFSFIIVVIIILIIILIIAIILLRRKKKKKSGSYIDTNFQHINSQQLNPSTYQTPSSKQSYPQSYIPKQPTTPSQNIPLFKCELCQATIMNPNNCPYCGWKKV